MLKIDMIQIKTMHSTRSHAMFNDVWLHVCDSLQIDCNCKARVSVS